MCRFRHRVTRWLVSGETTPRARVVPGFAMAAGIAMVSYRLRALSASGAVTAAIVGTAVHAGMGVRASVAMVGYFASSSALGRLPRQNLPRQRRGNRRDAVQVLASGGPAALFALLHGAGGTPMTKAASDGFYGSLAAAAADTWATEIGTRWGGQPRNIATLRRTSVGESGGVTIAGIAASFLASLAIAATAQANQEDGTMSVTRCVTGGMVGSLTDSLLGALVQEQRWCERCAIATELHVHTCGQPTTHLRGIPGLDNDVVNFLAGVAGGFAAIAVPGRDRVDTAQWIASRVRDDIDQLTPAVAHWRIVSS